MPQSPRRRPCACNGTPCRSTPHLLTTDLADLGQASTNYKEAFSLFDVRGSGRVSLDKLGDLLRACGQNPTLAEIQELEKSVGGDCE
jgi:Ca2+-binding EF-hand superfamily protein